MTKYIIGTISEMDTPMNASAKGAFALLDTLTEDPALPAEAVRAAVSHMEERFAADSIAAARAAFAMDRDSLPGAVELLTNLWIKTLTVQKIRSQAHTYSSAGSPMYQNVNTRRRTASSSAVPASLKPSAV